VKDNLTFQLQRERIKISNVVYDGMLAGNVGYIKLDDFTPGAGKEVEEAVLRLKKAGARSFILDLRDNPGGLLYEAVNIVNVFVPKGKEIVSTRGKMQEWNKTYTTLNEPVDAEVPVAVLTSGGSASAAEIVAGSLQDYDRAILVGQRTFGKGLVQTTRPLSYNAQLKVTTAKYYIPSGRCIQAIDYTHRKQDGTVERFADSVKTAFKTAHGRQVFDGGGLDPDVPVEAEMLGTLGAELIASNYTFEYATRYVAEHPTPPATLKGFRLSDAEYQEFVAWIKSRNFSYPNLMEKQADDLIASAKNERYYDELSPGLMELKTKIKANREGDFARFRKEVSGILEDEIAFHYSLHKGRTELMLDRQPEILEAARILSDPPAYKKLLQPE
jgi:carboxyl-terminal processing protease